MKKIILLFLVLVFCLMGCAPVVNGNVVSQTPEAKGNYSVIHLASLSYYALDYWEDYDHGYACYVYDGSDSGDLFCFKLEDK